MILRELRTPQDPLRTPGLDDRLRVTVGTPEQVDRLVAELDGFLAEPAA